MPRAGAGRAVATTRARGGRLGVSGVSLDPQTALVESKPIQQTLVLDGYPSQEQQLLLGPNTGSRRWGVAEERKSVQTVTWAAAKKQGLVKAAPPVLVTYTFVVPDHGRRDWDNYALICKPVQDGLVKAGILVGDHFAVLDGRVAFRVEKGHRALIVTIEPAGPPATGEGLE